MCAHPNIANASQRRTAPPIAPARGGLPPGKLRRAMERLTGESLQGVTVAEVARACQLSTSHFSRAFRQTVGTAPHQFLMQQRLGRAKALLRAETGTIADIAAACGFADHSHMCRVFAKLTGLTPTSWRQPPHC